MESSLKLCRHFLASASSSGSKKASKAWYLTSLLHGASWIMGVGGRVGRETRLDSSLITEVLIIVVSFFEYRERSFPSDSTTEALFPMPRADHKADLHQDVWERDCFQCTYCVGGT